jgi:hypothetical protein
MVFFPVDWILLGVSPRVRLCALYWVPFSLGGSGLFKVAVVRCLSLVMGASQCASFACIWVSLCLFISSCVLGAFLLDVHVDTCMHTQECIRKIRVYRYVYAYAYTRT